MTGTLLSQILQLLVQPPGNLIYHLVLAFAVLAGLQAISLNHSGESQTHARRLWVGFSTILIGQAILFFSSALGWQRIFEPQIVFPILERATIFISLTIIAWMWNFPKHNRFADTFVISLVMLAVLFFFIGLMYWTPMVGIFQFNQTQLDLIWTIGLLTLILATIILLFGRQVNRYGFGIGFFILVGIGSLAHLFLPGSASDIPAAVRLGLVCAFPLLPTIAHASRPAGLPGYLTQKNRFNENILRKFQLANPRIVTAWLEIAKNKDPSQIGNAISKAVSRTLVADLTFIVSTPDSISPLTLSCGYDIIREESIQGTQVDRRKTQLLCEALLHRKPLRLFSDSSNPLQDLAALASILGLKEAGNVLFAPFTSGLPYHSGMIVLSPYSKHEWSLEDQTLLQSICDEVGFLFSSTSVPVELSEEMERLNMEREYAPQVGESPPYPQTTDNAKEEQFAFFTSNQDQESRLEIAGLLAIQRENQETITRLENENHHLRDELLAIHKDRDSKRDIHHLENELRLTLEEIAHLQNSLGDANLRIKQLQQSTTPSRQHFLVDHSALGKIIQELRPPVSSILGYTELLMNESVGMIGASQKKFIDRIRTSSERLKYLLEETLQPSALSTSPIELARQPIEFDTVLNQAIDDISAILLEKKIKIRMDVPNDLPCLFADQDALQQVFIHLLRNAALATPAEGKVSLQVKIEVTDPKESFLLFQITDEGGGIPPAELTRVFSRQYRSDAAMIQGIGDNGVGLSIAKILIEAHSGRLWVECVPGKTSTYSVLLPVQPYKDDGIKNKG